MVEQVEIEGGKGVLFGLGGVCQFAAELCQFVEFGLRFGIHRFAFFEFAGQYVGGKVFEAFEKIFAVFRHVGQAVVFCGLLQGGEKFLIGIFSEIGAV